MIQITVIDKDRVTATAAPSLYFPIVFNKNSPAYIEIAPNTIGYQSGALIPYTIENIQVAPLVEYKINVKGKFDGTNYVKIMDEVSRTGSESYVYQYLTAIKALYPVRIEFTTSVATPDTTLYIYLPITEMLKK